MLPSCRSKNATCGYVASLCGGLRGQQRRRATPGAGGKLLPWDCFRLLAASCFRRSHHRPRPFDEQITEGQPASSCLCHMEQLLLSACFIPATVAYSTGCLHDAVSAAAAARHLLRRLPLPLLLLLSCSRDAFAGICTPNHHCYIRLALHFGAVDYDHYWTYEEVLQISCKPNFVKLHAVS